MSESKTTPRVRFSIGDLVQHELFHYRGVVIGADPQFEGTDEWYETVARSRPPKDRPWYHVLPHGATHQTCVADRNLQPDHSGHPIDLFLRPLPGRPPAISQPRWSSTVLAGCPWRNLTAK